MRKIHFKGKMSALDAYGVIANDIFELVSASSALEPDQALNQGFCGKWLAYRLPATTSAITAGLNYGLSHDLSIDMSMQYIDVDAKNGNAYKRTMARASVLARF